MKNYIQIFLTLILLSFSPISKAEEFEIKHADTLEADKQQITIMGNILINYKDAVIEAPDGKIETDEEGQPDKAIFFGRAKLKLKDRKIEADKITVSIKNKTILAEGNTISELKDKKNNNLIISSDYQELLWSGENANAKGNLKTTYEDTKVTSDNVKIIYKNKKPTEAIFSSNTKLSNLEQPTNITQAKEITFDINSHDIQALGNVSTTIWPDKSLTREKQDPVFLNTNELFINNETGTVSAKDELNKVKITYKETMGESLEGFLLKDKKDGKPEKIIFKGNASVNQPDKQLSSEEVVFNFKDQKLNSNTKTNIRPKTIIYKKE